MGLKISFVKWWLFCPGLNLSNTFMFRFTQLIILANIFLVLEEQGESHEYTTGWHRDSTNVTKTRISFLMWILTSLSVHDSRYDNFGIVFSLLVYYLSHTPLCISIISGVCVQGMWNTHVKGQVTEMRRLKVNSNCDTALFVSMYDITMVQP